MTIEEIKIFIEEYKLKQKRRQRYYVDNRALLFAYLHQEYGYKPSRIKDLFDLKSHTNVTHALTHVYPIRNDKDFKANTKKLKERIPEFEIKEYIVKPYVKQSLTKTTVSVTLDKESFTRYIKTKDINIIYDFLYNDLLNETKELKSRTKRDERKEKFYTEITKKT